MGESVFYISTIKINQIFNKIKQIFEIHKAITWSNTYVKQI